MGNVLYAARFRLDPLALIPLAMLLLLPLVPRAQERAFARAGKALPKRERRWTKGIVGAAMLFSAVFFVLSAEAQIDLYRSVIAPYRSGEYEIVEGSVENFSHERTDGQTVAAFDLAGVHFHYSDDLSAVGYRPDEPFGGAVHADGQNLRIGYVRHPDFGNVVVHVELWEL